MKDPTVEDPRLVSAYSVYKGLANLKSYVDTSNDQKAIAKRNKRKARKRRNKENGELKTTPPESSAAASKLESVPETRKKLPSSAASTESSKNNSTFSVLELSDGKDGQGQSVSGNKKRKKKKKNKKKAAGNAASNHVYSTLTLDSSDDEEEPPTKSRRQDLLPNPLSTVKHPAVANQAHMKTNGVPTSSQADKKKTSTFVSNSNTTGQAVKTKKPVVKQTAQSEKPSSFTFLGKKNGDTEKLNAEGKKKSLPVSSTSLPNPYTVTSKVPPVSVKSVLSPGRTEDSVSQAKTTLEWLLHPVKSDEFMKSYWEKKPLLIKRKHSDAADYYKWILTTQSFDDILRRNAIKYGVNLDITSYVNGKRETLSESMQGRVRPAVVWDYYNNGCSVRMLNPQTYVQQLWRLNSSLQEWFGSFVGANMYLTPPDSQGFAPHYDDIEAFILQVEGKKRWKLYAARNENEKLPRFSSRNFSEESDNLGEPILDVVLEEGDLLYFPRGVIHQAQTVDGEHSLHITLSCNQLNTYGDLLKHHLNHALDKFIAKDVNFRRGLPTDYLSFMGIAHENTKDSELKKKRKTFANKIEELVTKLAKEPADFASDSMGKKFIWDSLPPYLNSAERETTVVEDGEFMQNGKVMNRVEFGPETEIKFIRKNCVRLVVEDEQIKLYFASENPLIYHEEDEPQYLEISVELSPALNHLISQYPNYTKIENLPISSDDIGQKIQLASDLWERGLLFTKEPLEPCDYDDFDSGDSDVEQHEQSENASLNDEDDEEVESIDLSDLPAEDDDDDIVDDFYDTTLGLDSNDSMDDEEHVSELFLDDDDGEQVSELVLDDGRHVVSKLVLDDDDGEQVSEEDDTDNDSNAEDGEGIDYGVDEDSEIDEDDEDYDDIDSELEETDDDDPEDDDEFDFDELDRMGESEEDTFSE